MRKKVVLKNKYMQEELCEEMKKYSWSAGIPFMGNHSGYIPVICFPALDANHQVHIQLADGAMLGKHIPNNVVYIDYSDEAGSFGGAVAKNAIGEKLGIISVIIRKFSPNEKKAKEQVLKLVEELKSVGL